MTSVVEGRPTEGMTGAGRREGRRPCSRRTSRQTCSQPLLHGGSDAPMGPWTPRTGRRCGIVCGAAALGSPQTKMLHLVFGAPPARRGNVGGLRRIWRKRRAQPPSTGVEARGAAYRPCRGATRWGPERKRPAVWAAGRCEPPARTGYTPPPHEKGRCPPRRRWLEALGTFFDDCGPESILQTRVYLSGGARNVLLNC